MKSLVSYRHKKKCLLFLRKFATFIYYTHLAIMIIEMKPEMIAEYLGNSK